MSHRIAIVRASLLVTVLLSQCALAVTVPMTEDGDAWVRESDPTGHRDDVGDNLAFGNSNSGHDYTYLRFDLTAIPDAAFITSAILTIRNRNDLAYNSDVVVTEAADSWNESTITFNTRPSVGSILGSFVSEGGAPGVPQLDTLSVTAFVQANLIDNAVSFQVGNERTGGYDAGHPFDASFMRSEERRVFVLPAENTLTYWTKLDIEYILPEPTMLSAFGFLAAMFIRRR